MILLALAAAVTPAEKTPAAARAVVRRYYAAIDAGHYRTAYACWDRGGAASGQRYADFVRGFARTRHVRVTTGAPTDGDAAAGSLYITVPVSITATLKDGTPQRFHGVYRLRRVNDVDGATLAQLRWHIDSATLRRG